VLSVKSYLPMCACVCKFVCVRVSVRVCNVCKCVSVCVQVCACICAHVQVYTSVCLYVQVCACVCAHVHCVQVCLCLCECACVLVYMHVQSKLLLSLLDFSFFITGCCRSRRGCCTQSSCAVQAGILSWHRKSHPVCCCHCFIHHRLLSIQTRLLHSEQLCCASRDT
jgi:hypothetical protein